MANSHARQGRRQARGRIQIDRILAAAAQTFAERGYDATSTNHIASAAGISPGSLYQFFANKEAIAAKLCQRYASDIADTHASSLSAIDPLQSTLTDVIHAIVAPVDAYRKAHGAFVELFLAFRLPDRLSEPVALIESSFEERVMSILQCRNPTKSSDDVRTAAATVFVLFRGYMGRPAPSLVPLSEIETALGVYLEAKGFQ